MQLKSKLKHNGFYNDEFKQKFIVQYGYDLNIIYTLFGAVEEYEIKYGKDIYAFDKNEFKTFTDNFRVNTFSYAQKMVYALRNYIRWAEEQGEDINLFHRIFFLKREDIEKLVEDNKLAKSLINQKDLNQILEALKNVTTNNVSLYSNAENYDKTNYGIGLYLKVIILLIYGGVGGDFKNIVKLNFSDIKEAKDNNSNTITLFTGGKQKLSQDLIDSILMLKDWYNDNFYCNQNSNSSSRGQLYFYFLQDNEDSVFKMIYQYSPNMKNDEDLIETLRIKLTKTLTNLKKYLYKEKGIDIDITYNNLYISGFFNYISNILKTFGITMKEFSDDYPINSDQIQIMGNRLVQMAKEFNFKSDKAYLYRLRRKYIKFLAKFDNV